jgi:predicted metalloendopeptidase
MHAASIPTLFNLGVEADFKDPNTNIAQFFQGGLGLPDRDYYLSEDHTKKTARERLRRARSKDVRALGDKPESAKATAAKVMALETGPREELEAARRAARPRQDVQPL